MASKKFICDLISEPLNNQDSHSGGGLPAGFDLSSGNGTNS
jgi:hypothetical protein